MLMNTLIFNDEFNIFDLDLIFNFETYTSIKSKYNKAVLSYTIHEFSNSDYICFCI